MRQPMQDRDRRAGAIDVWVLLILAMVCVIVAIGLFAWNKYGALKELEETGVEAAIGELKLVHKMSGQIVELAEAAKVFAGTTAAQGTLLSFFSDQVTAAGIKTECVKGMQELPLPQPKDGLVEVGFKIHFQGISRDQLAKFLFNVEDKKPFIKSKTIDMKLDEFHNIVETFVTLVYYDRKGP